MTDPIAPVPAAPAVAPTPTPARLTNTRPAEAFLLADIERARDYRKAYYQYAIGIATSLLAFTLAFQPTLKAAPSCVLLEVVGWGGLGLVIAAGLRVHMTWANFFISFRDFDNRGKRDEGKRQRDAITVERRILDWLILIGLVIGVADVVGFTAVNLHNVAPKTAGS